MMREKIPTNVIIKTSYDKTKQLLRPRYFDEIIDQIVLYIKEHPQHYEDLEIEAKLGKFEFKGDHVKVLEKINETFIIQDNIKTSNPNTKFIFNAGISSKDFYLIWSALDKESTLNGANIECIKPQTYKDILYSTNKRQSSIYLDGIKIKEEIIRKENKKNINVRNGGFDFRITCSEEIETEIDEEKDIKESERDKFRVSYQLSYYRVDLTISKDSKNNNEIAYEIEIELNKLKTELVGKNKLDEVKIRTILDRFIQNIMNLYSVLLPEAIYFNSKHDEELSIHNHLTQEEIQSRYGNYFKNNLPKNK
jgi:hypothetical protein